MRLIFEKLKASGWRFWVFLLAFLAISILGISLARTNAQLKAAQVTPTPTASAGQPRRRVVIIVHGDSTSKFWPKVKLGAEKGSQDYGIDLEFIRLTKASDFTEMSSLIEKAVASKPDGMAISVPDRKALEPAILKIKDAKIPFIVINSGQHDAQALGALTYIGQLDYEAGRQAGIEMATQGVRHAYCINHDPKNAAVIDRCKGFKDALLLVGGHAEILVIDRKDPEGTKVRIKDVLTLFPETDGLLTTADMPLALEVVQAMGKTGQVKIGGFDFSTETLQSISAGEVLFAIDQQPYLQGYLPMTFFNLLFINANTISQAEVATGPNFITPEDVGIIQSLSESGTR